MPRLPRLLLLLYCLALCFIFASSAPVRAKRQNTPGKGTTSSIIDTPNGPMVQTCTVTLTPTANGKAFQEVKSCNMKPVTPNGASSATLPPTAGSSTSSAQSANSTPSTSPTTSAPPTPPTPVVTTSSSASSSTPSPGTTSGTPATISPTSASKGSTSAHKPFATTPAPSSVPFAAPGVSPTNSSITGSTTSTSASSTPAAEADQASQSATQNFKIPGKSLSVLPIGLGVFAGILVIALIVVGLVTYERTKYRKVFRQQRLAETGPNMGQV